MSAAAIIVSALVAGVVAGVVAFAALALLTVFIEGLREGSSK